jgi:Fe-S cluster assembly iron-binding protein IscA
MQVKISDNAISALQERIENTGKELPVRVYVAGVG